MPIFEIDERNRPKTDSGKRPSKKVKDKLRAGVRDKAKIMKKRGGKVKKK